jgi:hypothetical protein
MWLVSGITDYIPKQEFGRVLSALQLTVGAPPDKEQPTTDYMMDHIEWLYDTIIMCVNI